MFLSKYEKKEEKAIGSVLFSSKDEKKSIVSVLCFPPNTHTHKKKNPLVLCFHPHTKKKNPVFCFHSNTKKIN